VNLPPSGDKTDISGPEVRGYRSYKIGIYNFGGNVVPHPYKAAAPAEAEYSRASPAPCRCIRPNRQSIFDILGFDQTQTENIASDPALQANSNRRNVFPGWRRALPLPPFPTVSPHMDATRNRYKWPQYPPFTFPALSKAFLAAVTTG